MYRDAIQFVASVNDQLDRRDLSKMVENFKLPLPVYSDNGVIFLKTRAELRKAIAFQFAQMNQKVVCRVETEVIEMWEAPAQTLVSTCRHRLFSQSNSDVSDAVIRYFLERQSETFQIAMVEYEKSCLDCLPIKETDLH